MNARRKGTRIERRSRRLLETAGYAVTRAAGSLGAWHLVGIGATDVVLLQVKSNRPPAQEGWTVMPADRAAGREGFTFEDMAKDLERDYAINGKWSLETLGYQLRHLRASFAMQRAVDITTDRVHTHLQQRQPARIIPLRGRESGGVGD